MAWTTKDTQDLHDEGYHAFEQGFPLESCPYGNQIGERNRRGYWISGWGTAKRASVYCDTHPLTIDLEP